MRQRFHRSTWAGNGALIVVGALLLSFSMGGMAAAAPPPPTIAPSTGVVSVLQTAAHGNATVSFQVTPVSSPSLPVWIDIFSPSNQSLTQNGQPVLFAPQGGITSSVYSVVYTVYLKLAEAFATSASYQAFPYENGTAVLYSVYLGTPTPPPTPTSSAPPATTPPSTQITVGANQPVGSLSTGTITIAPTVSVPATVLQLNGTELTQAVSTLGSGTSNLQIQLTTTSVPTGNAALVDLPSTGLSALTTAGKGLEVDTPDGNITLPPTTLSQISSQLQPGQQAQIELTPLPSSQISTIVSSATTSGGIYQIGGTTVEVSVNITDSSGNVVGNFEPSAGGTLNLSLPYSPSVSGSNAEKLGLYRYDTSTNTFQYVPGSHTNLSTGTVSATLTHLSTYAVLLDTQTFPDIQGYWAQSDIEIMIAHHVVDGISATAFDPTGPVTRGEFALMLARALNLSMPAPSAAPFSDVPATSPYAGAIAAAVQAGIVNGYPNGTFQPDANITRQELAVMIDRAMAAANQPTTLLPAQIPALLAPFTDALQLANWAQQAVAADIEQHIINGVTASTLDPAATTTRAEATVMLQRLMAYLGTL